VEGWDLSWMTKGLYHVGILLHIAKNQNRSKLKDPLYIDKRIVMVKNFYNITNKKLNTDIHKNQSKMISQKNVTAKTLP